MRGEAAMEMNQGTLIREIGRGAHGARRQPQIELPRGGKCNVLALARERVRPVTG